ncbi:MAG: hypothetical protein EPO24_06685 [Bacteroidetes bacterium]|nr:MAG: hypothetical protein EPO24_06685 [Bacteroidota bacterium]
MKTKEDIVNQKTEFLSYLKTKFMLIHNSNIFLRDLHFGLMSYIREKNGKKIQYFDGEQLAKSICTEFEKNGIFIKIDHQSWKLNYPEFALPRVEKKAP